MEKLYGYAGKLLRVDLTSGKISQETFTPKTARKWVGGTGFGAKMLFDEVKKGTEWSDAENRLMIASGPLGGTAVGGSGTVSVISKGPMTNGAGATQANGFFGAFLRFCGYEGIIVQGKAPKWSYLYIDGNKAEIRDAASLVGKDTWETNDAIREALGVKNEHAVAVAAIGPAGENLVRFASLFFDKGHTASKNGMGAVMGSKKLKAVVVARGRKRPAVKDPEGLNNIANQFHESIVSTPAGLGSFNYGTLNLLTEQIHTNSGALPVKNYTTDVWNITPEDLRQFEGPSIRAKFDPKPEPCYACRMHHCHMFTIPDGPHKGFVGDEPEYELFNAFGPMIDSKDVSEAVYLANVVDRLGMDVNEASWCLGLAMECYDKKILNSHDTNGIDLRWGNARAVEQMMRGIATRQGFGDILAEGAMRAAQKIGGEAPQFAIGTMKGNTPRLHDDRNRWQKLFDTCISQMGTDEGYAFARPNALGITAKVTTGYDTSPEDIIPMNVQCRGGQQFEDCLGACRFTVRTDVAMMANALAVATGWDFTPQEGLDVGRRIVNLLRAFNIRCGHTAEMDAPSPRYGSTPTDGPSAGKSFMSYFYDLRGQYYEGMGWDKATGKPLPETLKKYGLEYAIPELWEK